MQATKRHHFAVHANIQALHWQHNLDDMWKVALGYEHLTFAKVKTNRFSWSPGHNVEFSKGYPNRAVLNGSRT